MPFAGLVPRQFVTPKTKTKKSHKNLKKNQKNKNQKRKNEHNTQLEKQNLKPGDKDNESKNEKSRVNFFFHLVSTVGFIIMFGALFVKTWRVWRLFANQSMDIVRISDMDLLLSFVPVVFVMAILLISMSIAGNLRAGIVVVDNYRASLNYWDCMPQQSAGWLGALIAVLIYAGLIILGGLALAWKVRQIPYSVYDESKVRHESHLKKYPARNNTQTNRKKKKEGKLKENIESEKIDVTCFEFSGKLKQGIG